MIMQSTMLFICAYLLVVQGAVLAGLSAATSGVGRGSGRSLAGRLSYAAASGACIGAYLALEFVPGEPLLQVQH